HAQDSGCATCHRMIDPLGFSFEQFDGMGVYREKEGDSPVDSSTEIKLGLDFDGSYANSNELAAALAQSEAVRECFGRQIFRSAAGEGQDARDYEKSFDVLWSALPPDAQGVLLENLSRRIFLNLLATTAASGAVAAIPPTTRPSLPRAPRRRAATPPP